MTDPLLAQLARLQTSTLANALDDIGFDGVLAGLQPAAPGMKLVGRAVTVRETTGPRGSFPVEDFRVGHMIDAAGPGEVIVVANGGAPVSTWGGMASYAAKLKGIEGLVCDGGCRDRDEIARFGFPLFARHIVPTPGKTRLKVETIGEPIVCCGVRVRPGDLIVADDTGVVCIPAEHAQAVTEAATRFAADDERAMQEMAAGLSFTEALKKFAKI